MRMTLAVHIIAGSLGIVSGLVALYATKGATLHRRAGMVFVCVMLTMAVTGMTIAAVRGVAPEVNIPAALISAYLVITALTTVRPPSAGEQWLTIGAMLVALATALVNITFAYEAIANGGMRDGMPPFPFVMFGLIGMLGASGDIRVLRSGALRGSPRLARHLWRMSTALFIAALSFFIGQSKVFPEPVRIMPLLALPVLTVLVTMFYWLWRVRIRRNLRGIVGVARANEISPRPV